jgi:hypothetical protein
MAASRMTQDLTAAATGGKMTLRETIAKAVMEQANAQLRPPGKWDALSQPGKAAWLPEADAALEAIRAAGPTEAMVEAGARAIDAAAFASRWQGHPEDQRARQDTALDEARACLTAALAAKET